MAAKENRKIREMAMLVLFAFDVHSAEDERMARQVVEDATEDGELREKAIEMARGAWGQREGIDQRIERHAPQWPPRRQPSVDRNILRLAVWELTNTKTLPSIIIDDSIELAKRYSTESSGSFINAVLDAILKEHAALIAPSGS